MKKIFALFTIMTLTLAFSVVNAQSTPASAQKVEVNISDLTPLQIAKIQAEAQVQTAQYEIDKLKSKLETYGNWVGVGGEIGTAVKEGLTAVVDVADKFGSTKVGKFTMIMIAYKIMGRDFIRIIIGLLFFTVFVIFLFNYHKKNFTTRRIAIEDNGWKFWLPKKYEIVEPKQYEGYEFVKWLNIAMLLGSFGLTYAIMFA